MSSDSTNSSNSSLTTLNDYTARINGVFKEHKTFLDGERQNAIEDIEYWRFKLENRIQKHAKEQIELVNKHYDRLQLVFDEKHRENLETADAYYEAKKNDLLDELYQACRALKFETVKLEYTKFDVRYVEAKIVEAQLETNESSDVKEREHENKNVNKMRNVDPTDASLDTTTSTVKQTDSQRSAARRRRRTQNELKDNVETSKNQIEDTDRSDNKCPLCFMIFPSNMVSRDRQQHVNEHYSGD